METNKTPVLMRKLAFPALLLALGFFTYGVYIMRHGFYLDDWYIMLFQTRFGPSGFLSFFAADRPFNAYVYRTLMPIFHDSRAGWQLFAILTRWLATLSFWALLNQAFPTKQPLWKIAAVIFMVYPGFRFHYFAIMYSQGYILFAVYFLSYTFMVKALNVRKKRFAFLLWTAAAVLCLVIGIVPQEYYYGMELFRPILIWLILNRDCPKGKRIFGTALLHWLPYLAVFAGFTVFRIAQSSTYAYQIGIMETLTSGGLRAWLELGLKALKSVYEAIFLTWWDSLLRIKGSLRSPKLLYVLGAMILGAVLLIFAFWQERRSDSTQNKAKSYGLGIMAAGIFITGIALIPFYAGSFEVGIAFPWNRFLLSLTPGVSIFFAGFLGDLVRPHKLMVVTLAGLAALAIGSQTVTAGEFVDHWDQQKDFWQQLAWRVPELKPGTTLITDDLPFSQYYSGTSLTGALNIIYSPEDESARLENILLLMASPQAKYIPEYEPGMGISYNLRSLTFAGNTDALLVFHKPANSCLQVIFPTDSPDAFAKSANYAFWTDAIPLSNLETIVTEPVSPVKLPERYFGEEDQNTWCYFYEKAELARQDGDWEDVISLFDQALLAGFAPLTTSEWAPLLEAYAQTDQTNQLSTLNQAVIPPEPEFAVSLCDLYQRLQRDSSLSETVLEKLAQLANQKPCVVE